MEPVDIFIPTLNIINTLRGWGVKEIFDNPQKVLKIWSKKYLIPKYEHFYLFSLNIYLKYIIFKQVLSNPYVYYG